MTKKIGIIGGSGVYQIEGAKVVGEYPVDTPFGRPSDVIAEIELDGNSFFFIPRHGKKHSILPHEINYRANIFALKKLGVEYLISVTAVGSLKEEMPPESFVLPDQLIDWTKGKRERTFFGNGIVAHVSTAKPVNKTLQEMIGKACDRVQVKHHIGGDYICIEGPQFSSKAESNLYRSFGASIIGMTAVPECYLAQEAGIAYGIIAMVTDFDCWKEEHCTVDEIMKVMKVNNQNAQKLIREVIPDLANNNFDFQKENTMAVLTPKDQMSTEQVELVETLLR